MLPSDLLVARRYRDTIRLGYAKLTEENLGFSRRLIDIFESHLDRRRRELEEAIREMEAESMHNYRYVRGISILLERRCRFEVVAAITPGQARDRLFHAVSEMGVPTTLDERRRVLEGEGATLGVSSEELEDSLYADLEEEQFLKEFEPVEAEAIVRMYNLGLTQTLLFKCTEMEFNASGNWQQIFRWIKLLGLIYTIRPQDEGYRVKVDGPVSLFKLGTKYGTRLAKLLPHVVAAPEWSIQAWILRRRGDHQLLKLKLDSLRHAGYLRSPMPRVREEYDSIVEESFAKRFNALHTGWTLTREPDALPVGRHVMIPDFLFEKEGMRVYMEVAGFWTPEYLKRKLDQLQGVEGVDMIVAADRGHACQQLNSLGRKLNIVYYKGKVPLRPILRHLKAREESLKTSQLDQLQGMEFRIEGKVVHSAELAKRLGVMEEVVVEALRQRDIPGYRLLGDALISDSTIEEIGRRLEERIEEGPLSFKETTELIEEHGGIRPSRILEHLGYTIEWRGISPEMATVHRTR
jgi:predicted nuclease of restriction endonuclease-like RecB superfamily